MRAPTKGECVSFISILIFTPHPSFRLRKRNVPGVVDQACNPNCLEGRDREDRDLRLFQTKSFYDPYLNQWPDVVMYTCHPQVVEKHK
jgi:hypothetical protein